MTPETFTHLYRTHWATCIRYARRCLQSMPGNAVEPEDLVQQVFLNIWERGRKDHYTCGTLIFMVRQRGIDRYRSVMSEKRTLEGANRIPPYDPIDIPAEIREAMAGLPTRHREALELSIQGFDGVEIAGLFNAKGATVRYWRRQAIMKIKSLTQ